MNKLLYKQTVSLGLVAENNSKEDLHMATKTTLVNIGDLLFFSETKGYFWNQFIDMLREDNILPWCDSPLKKLYVGVGEEYGWSQEVSAVVDDFCKEHGGDITINLAG